MLLSRHAGGQRSRRAASRGRASRRCQLRGLARRAAAAPSTLRRPPAHLAARVDGQAGVAAQVLEGRAGGDRRGAVAVVHARGVVGAHVAPEVLEVGAQLVGHPDLEAQGRAEQRRWAGGERGAESVNVPSKVEWRRCGLCGVLLSHSEHTDDVPPPPPLPPAPQRLPHPAPTGGCMRLGTVTRTSYTTPASPASHSFCCRASTLSVAISPLKA